MDDNDIVLRLVGTTPANLAIGTSEADELALEAAETIMVLRAEVAALQAGDFRVG